MRKNIAGQLIAFQGVAKADGEPVTTGTPTVYFTINGGAQGTGVGTSTHEGNGEWSYAPVQAETNGDHVAFTFTLANAINQTLNSYPVSFDPTDAVRLGLTTLPNASADAPGGLPISDLGGLDMDAMNTNVNDIETVVDSNAVAIADLNRNIFYATDIVIGTITTPTEFILTSGPAYDMSGGLALFFDASNGNNQSFANIVSYAGGTGVLIIDVAPEFVVAVSDTVTLVVTIPADVNVDSWNGVPLSTTNPLPNAAPDTAGGIPISDAGGLDMDGLATTINISALNNFNPATDTVANVTLVATTTTNTDMLTVSAVSGGVWDELLTGASHNINTSAGKRLRQIALLIFSEGTAQSGGSNTIQLASGAVTINKQFVRAKVIIVGGTGAGQESVITDSVALTDTLSVKDSWLINPDATSEYEVIPAQSHAATQGGYYTEDAVHISASGSTGAILGVDGINTNPIDDGQMTNARSVADAQKLTKYIGITGANYTLNASHDLWSFEGSGSTCNLNSQSVNGARFTDMIVTGIGLGSGVVVARSCLILNVSLANAVFIECPFAGTFNMTGVANYRADGCESSSAGAPVFNYGAVGNQGLQLSNWSGPVEIQNMGTGTDTCYISGDGSITVNANCTAGTLTYAGDITVVDNSGGAVTIVKGVIGQTFENTSVDIPLQISLLNNYDPASDQVIVATNNDKTGYTLSQAGLAQFMTVDTGETIAVAGSVSKISQGSAGGNVTVGAMTSAALLQFVQDDTGETAATDGSVAELSQGGSGTSIYPFTASCIQRVKGCTLYVFTGETATFTILPTDDTGAAIDTTGLTLEIVIESQVGSDLEVIADGAIIKTITSITFTTTDANVCKGSNKWSVRRTDTNEIIAYGDYFVKYAAELG